MAVPALYFAGLAACSSMQTKTAQDPAADLGIYHTYAWAPGQPSEAINPNASMLDETIKAEVDKELVSRGLKQTDPQQADLLISYAAISKNKLNYGSVPGPYLWGPDYAAYPTREGSLTLLFVDPKTHRTVWQGTATDVIGEAAGSDQKQISSAVDDLLKKYPVKPVA